MLWPAICAICVAWLYAVWTQWPSAWAQGYAHLSTLIPGLVAALLYMSRARLRSIAEPPSLPLVYSLAGAMSLGVYIWPRSLWIPLALGPAILLWDARRSLRWRPELLLLSLTAPLDQYVDAHLGSLMRTFTAQASGGLASVFSSSSAWAGGVKLACGASAMFVTPACSGARNLIGILVLVLVLGHLWRLGRAAVFGLLALAAMLVMLANVFRIAALCLSASEGTFALAQDLHGPTGTMAFIGAYVMVLMVARRLSPR